MSLDLHTVSIKKGSAPPSDLSRLVMSMLQSAAIPGPVGEMTAATLLSPGAGYTSIPTAVGANGTGGTITPSMALATSAVAAAGATYAPGDTSTLTGGTAATQAILEVLTTKIVTAPAVAAAGTGYVPNDTISGAGTGVGTAPVFLVTDTQAVSATIVNGGTGGTPGAVTLVGTTGTGTKFQATGTINGSGVLTGALVVSVAGDYTVNPTNIANEPVTNNASATGIVVAVVLGVKTVTVSSGGSFSANNTSAGGITQASTSGVGTGVTFTLTAAKYGVNTYAVQNAGSYSVLPSSPISQGSSSGSGTGFTLTASTWQLQSIAASGGINYTNGSAITFSGGAGTTQATGQIITNPIGEPVTIAVTMTLPPTGAAIFATPNGPAGVEVNGKSTTGFNLTFHPRTTSEPVLATAYDLLVLH